jgi:predicted nucleic acid-binding Zn ribbon protein
MPVLADDFLGSHGSESRALSPPHVQNSGAPMTETTQVPPDAARALVEGLPGSSDGHLCPVCGEPLRPRQRVCSGRCRAELSRRRQAQLRHARDQQIRELLVAALDLMGKDGPP